MTDESHFDPPSGPPRLPEPIAPVPDAQTMAEAALGRALLMVQRMEEDARQRAELVSSQRLEQAEREAGALLQEARERAAAIAEITRDSVARVLADEHTALLEGLRELADLEQRLRDTVATSHQRIAHVLAHGTESGVADAGPELTASPVRDAVAPPAPTSFSVADQEGQPSAPASLGELDLDARVAGADDAFFADLRQAVDGSSSIAGREQPNYAGALSVAAAAATAVVAEPMRLTDPIPARAAHPGLRVVPPVPVAPDAPDRAAPGPVVPTTFERARETAPFDVPDPGTDTGAPAGESVSRRERGAKKRSRWAMVGTGLRNLGILLLLFVAFQLWGTAALEHRDQAKLRRSFQLAVASQSSPSTPLSGGDPADPSTVTTPTTVVAPPSAPSGEAVAVIKIPKIGVEQAVVEGTGVGDLRKGPGHYRNTPLPGQPGNAAIAGHRTTYGAPFNRIDELAPGDPILVTTLQGNFKYVVSEAPFPVSPSKNDVLFNKSDNRLTLTTCHPKYSAEKRLIVVATLAAREKPAPASKPAKNPRPRTASDSSTSGDAGALLPALFWGALCAMAYAGMVFISRRWVRRAALVLGTPIVLALLFPFFEQLSRLLPANY